MAEPSEKQQLFDVEATSAAQPAADTLRQLGHERLEAVINKAQAGQDPWEFHQPPKGHSVVSGHTHDADVAAVGALLERYRPLLLSMGFVLAQGSSWVLMKGSLSAMHTPAVLAFLHLLVAAVLQLVLVAQGLLPAPQLSAAGAKGALVPAAVHALQLLLVMWVLEHSSVFLLCSWCCVVPLLLGASRVADVAGKRWLLPGSNKQLPWLAAAAVGLGLEVSLDRQARSPLAYMLLVLWAVVVAGNMIWQQLKVDATLGHIIMEPEFLYRARDLSDQEAALSPSSKALLTSALPALPVLILGLVSLEAKDLVDHEPSVPTLRALLLSLLAFAAARNLEVLMASHQQPRPIFSLFLQGVAAGVAVVLELVERSLPSAPWCLLGVAISIGACCCGCVLGL